MVFLNSASEQFNYGIVREWVDDRRIAVITTQGNMSYAGVDAWVEVVIDTINMFPDDQPIAILENLRSPGQGFSPYIRQRAEDLYAAIPPSRQGYHAVVLREGVVYSLVSFFMRRRKQIPNLEERLFTQVEDGMNWLRTKLAHKS